MNFETKFNLNEKVWFMCKNKPTQITISCIEIFHVGTNQDMLSYKGEDAIDPKTWLDYQHLGENELFASKAELLESLQPPS